MIKFQSEETLDRFLDTMKFASQSTKAFENFIAKVKYLNAYQGDVIFGYDPQPHCFGLVFEGAGMIGGLVYHSYSEEWGVHT